MTKFYCPNKSIYYFLKVNTKGDEQMNYEKIQFEREIIDVVRSSYI